MAGKLQSLAFIVIILWCSSWLNILHGMARPLNTIVLHRDADQEARRAILESSHTVVRGSIVGRRQKDMIQKLEIDNSGPSPDGPGHKRPLPSYSKPNN
ncbi:hypothetical protein CR513_60527, partial [Mucuna pruriens]